MDDNLNNQKQEDNAEFENSNKQEFGGFTSGFLRNPAIKLLAAISPTVITIALFAFTIVLTIWPLYNVLKWFSNNFILLGGKQNGVELTGSEINRYGMPLTKGYAGLQGRMDTDEFKEDQLIGLWEEWSQLTNIEDMEGFNNNFNQIYEQYQTYGERDKIEHDDMLELLSNIITFLGTGNHQYDGGGLLGTYIPSWRPRDWGYSTKSNRSTNQDQESETRDGILIELDYIMISSTLFQSRFGGELLRLDDLEDLLPSTKDPFYYDSGCQGKTPCWKELHSDMFRESYEKKYYEKLHAGERIPATVGLEILSKYMIVMNFTKYHCTFDPDMPTGEVIDHLNVPEMIKYTVVVDRWKATGRIDPETGREYFECMGFETIYPSESSTDDYDIYFDIDCESYKNYLYGIGIFEDYKYSFVDHYYMDYLNNDDSYVKKEKKQQLVDAMYKLAIFFDDSGTTEGYILTECAQARRVTAHPNEPCDCESTEPEENTGETGEGGGGGGGGTSNQGEGAPPPVAETYCKYEDYTITVVSCDGSTVLAQDITMAEYIAGVAKAEVGGVVNGQNGIEAIKAFMVIAKSYLIYHVENQSNGVVVDDANKKITVPGGGSCFQAYSSGASDALLSAYDEVKDMLLLDKNTGKVFNATYAMCTDDPAGVQNLIFGFAGVDPASSGIATADSGQATMNLMPAGYLDYSYSQILEFITTVEYTHPLTGETHTGSPNSTCKVKNYYNDAVLGFCNGGTYSGTVDFNGNGSDDCKDNPNATPSSEPNILDVLNHIYNGRGATMNYATANPSLYTPSQDPNTGVSVGAWPSGVSSMGPLTSPRYYQAGSGAVIWPTDGRYTVNLHNGIDIIYNPSGTTDALSREIGGNFPVYAPASGTILYSEWGHTVDKRCNETAYSVRIRLDTPLTVNGRTIGEIYLTHMSGLAYGCGNRNYGSAASVPQCSGIHVNVGDFIGWAGTNSSAPHLHMSFYDGTGQSTSQLGTEAIAGIYGLSGAEFRYAGS